MRLKAKVVIVTGAATGIGKAIADRFVLEGAQVVYSDIAKEPKALKLEKGKSIYVKADVSDRMQVERLIDAALLEFGALDVMVNNAGISGKGGILEVSLEDFSNTLGVNLFGVFHGVQVAGRCMKEKGVKGSIVNMSSILGTVGREQAISYCTSKGGIVQLTRASAIDLAPHGIRVNAIAPGYIKTKMTESVLEDNAYAKIIRDNTPLGHLGSLADVAAAALYLASDESAYVTGTVLHVDGGWTAR